MLKIIAERFKQKHRTLNYPKVEPALSPRFLGKPKINKGQNDNCANCRKCLNVCEVNALALSDNTKNADITLDLGRCIFCGLCVNACPQNKIEFSSNHRMASFKRENLIINANSQNIEECAPKQLAIFKKSLRLRHISAAGCNACEADCNVLTTLAFDLPRFGIDFVASPRHADGIILTGPISENMREAVLDTYEAVPDPRIVIAVGACAISGGIFQNFSECHNGFANLKPELPIDLFIPGCPPNPWTILNGLLMLKNIKN